MRKLTILLEVFPLVLIVCSPFHLCYAAEPQTTSPSPFTSFAWLIPPEVHPLRSKARHDGGGRTPRNAVTAEVLDRTMSPRTIRSMASVSPLHIGELRDGKLFSLSEVDVRLGPLVVPFDSI